MSVRHVIPILVLAVCSLGGYAQGDVTFLDWDFIAQDTVLPMYSEVIPLDAEDNVGSYRVSLRYPVWARPTKSEMALIRRHRNAIGRDITVDSYVSTCRDRRMLNYSFVPVVHRNGRYLKLVSAEIHIETLSDEASQSRHAMLSQTRSASQRYRDNSVLSSGKWRKIHITQDGIYRLTPELLSQAGFDINNVHLYGYGGHEQSQVIDADNDFDDLEEVPLYKASDGSLLFWGNGLVKWNGKERVFNAYARQATYFLTDIGGATTTIRTVGEYEGSVASRVSTALGHSLYEVDDYAWWRAGRNLVDSLPYRTGSTRTYNVSVPHSLGNERVKVVFTSDMTTKYQYTVNDAASSGILTLYALNDHEWYKENPHELDVSSTGISASGNAKIDINVTQCGALAKLDYIAVNYTRSLSTTGTDFVRFGGGYSGMSGADPARYGGATEYSGIPAGHKVMRIPTRGREAVLISTRSEAGAQTFRAEEASTEYVAFSPDAAFPVPTLGDVVANQNLHSHRDVDMVIIVPSNGKLTTYAQQLADAHQTYQGMNCLVVRADEIYNEFSSGTPDATAYRRFLKMLYDRGSDGGRRPTHLLLFGACRFDNRMVSTKFRHLNPDDYLLCVESEVSNNDPQSFCWEDYFGLMADGKGGSYGRDVSDLAIGRMPVTTADEAQLVVNKTIAHLARTYAGDWSNRVVVIGDDDTPKEGGDKHTDQANKIGDAIGEIAPGLMVEKEFLDSYEAKSDGTRTTYPELVRKIEKYMTDGTLMMNFTGHGSESLLTHEFILELKTMRESKSDNLTVWFTAACNTSPIDNDKENLGVTSVLNDYGGAVAFIGTNRTVYSNQNYQLNSRFVQHAFSTDDSGRRITLGEALMLAKADLTDSGSGAGYSDYSTNKLQYALIGDPAIVVGNPVDEVILDSINGIVPDGEIELNGGGRVRIDGHVQRPDGTLIGDFNGKVNYHLFDCRSTKSTRGGRSNKVYTYEDWGAQINYGTALVKDGRFSTIIILPRDISYADTTGRFVFYALSEDKAMEANGYNEDFKIGGFYSGEQTDSVGPEIKLYINDRDFVDYGTTHPSPLLIADISDESCVQSSGVGLGHNIEAVLDGDAVNPINLNEYYEADADDVTKGTLMYQMKDLAYGGHSIRLRAWDFMNNFSESTLHFVVGGDGVEVRPELLSLVMSQPSGGCGVDFAVTYDTPGVLCTVKLEIYSLFGGLQWRSEVDTASDSGVIRLPWDGRNGAGALLRDGVYVCKVTCSYDGHSDSIAKKFILYNNNKE